MSYQLRPLVFFFFSHSSCCAIRLAILVDPGHRRSAACKNLVRKSDFTVVTEGEGFERVSIFFQPSIEQRQLNRGWPSSPLPAPNTFPLVECGCTLKSGHPHRHGSATTTSRPKTSSDSWLIVLGQFFVVRLRLDWRLTNHREHRLFHRSELALERADVEFGQLARSSLVIAGKGQGSPSLLQAKSSTAR